MADNLRVQIRWLIRRDLESVAQIERAAFPEPWTVDDYIDCCRQCSVIGMVAESDLRIVGAMVYELKRDQIRLLNFVVDPQFHRRGVGTQMAQRLIGKLHQQRREQITLVVDEANLAAQLFFRSQGFLAVRVERNFYNDGRAAYHMRYSLVEADVPFRGVNRISAFV